MMNKVASQVVMMATAIAALTACSKGAGSFSILKDADDFKQEAVFVPKKVDILWVIDNSGSMETSQNNLTASFASFINRFQTQGFDFHMAVTTTEAWDRQFNANSNLSMIKDGAVLKYGTASTHSGYYVMDQNTPNLASVFAVNAKQGTLGNGDERPLESMKQTLLDSRNAAFRRADAFLAVIIVSDEEDSSGSSSAFESPGKLYPVQNYVDFLGSLSGSGNFNVSTISVDTESCRATLDAGTSFKRVVSTRLPAIADLTQGVKASLCGNFGTSLEVISNNIITLTSVFKLSREPDLSTLKVFIDGVQIAEDATNGYTYNPADLTITFHGTAVPGSNSSVKIDYYPVGLATN